MFLDDDLRFYKNSFKIMNSNIRKYKKKYVGFCFNNTHLNKKKTLFEQVKTSSFIEKLGLYSAKNGVVLDNGWQTKIENDSIYYSYHRNNQPEAVEEASAQLKDRPVMTIHSLPLYLKKIPLNRNFTKEIYFNETFRPFTIKAVEEVEINIKGYGLMTCFYIYVISEDTSNDEEVRIYIDKKTKTIVSKEYIVHESNSTNNTFPKSTGYEALIDKDYEADISDPNNTDSFDYIGAAFGYINKSNDTLNALLNIDKASSKSICR